MIQSGRCMTDISGITSDLDNFVISLFKVLESYSKELSNIDTKKYKNNKNNFFIDPRLTIWFVKRSKKNLVREQL